MIKKQLQIFFISLVHDIIKIVQDNNFDIDIPFQRKKLVFLKLNKE